MTRARVIAASLGLMFLMNVGAAAEPPAIMSEARLAYDAQVSQARERIQMRAAIEAHLRSARIEARRGATGRRKHVYRAPASELTPPRTLEPSDRGDVLMIEPPPK